MISYAVLAGLKRSRDTLLPLPSQADDLKRAHLGRSRRSVTPPAGIPGPKPLPTSPNVEPECPSFDTCLPPGAPSPDALPATDPDAPNLFTAVQEQLGLKLESARGPVEVVVIDRLERPTPD